MAGAWDGLGQPQIDWQNFDPNQAFNFNPPAANAFDPERMARELAAMSASGAKSPEEWNQMKQAGKITLRGPMSVANASAMWDAENQAIDEGKGLGWNRLTPDEMDRVAEMQASRGIEVPDMKKAVNALSAIGKIGTFTPPPPPQASANTVGSAGKMDPTPMLNMYNNTLGALLLGRGGK